MRISIISFTANGDDVNNAVYKMFLSHKVKQWGKTVAEPPQTTDAWWDGEFSKADIIVFIGEAESVIRMIAPHIKNGSANPAVISIDESAKFVIPILSGRVKARDTARKVAERLGAIAVVAGDTDIGDIWAVDTWARHNGYVINNPAAVKDISSELLSGKPVGLFSDFAVEGRLPGGVRLGTDYEYGICISDRLKKPFARTLNIVPIRYVLGVDSRRDADTYALEELFEEVCFQYKIAAGAVAEVRVLETKRDVKAIRHLCRSLGLKPTPIAAAVLNGLDDDFTDVAGMGNVCERAALTCGGTAVVPKTRGRGVTLAAAVYERRVTF